MTREEETRIVSMYFNNEDFEKNAKQTINTLGELKKSMNLEESVKGFDVFDKMKRTAGMEKMQQTANKLKTTFSEIGGTMTKAFSVAGEPMKALENTFSTLRGYVSRYLGFDFASKIVSGVENAVRGLTVQPVSQGWTEYESKVDSVRTIMASTGRSIEDVSANLQIMEEYANQTIYSLSDMTSNLGKFTNNGVALEDATQAMMGIANAAAAAGQGTQQASMAMYNFSQAIGVGKMTSIDWKSIENANMATKELKNTFIEIAAQKGQLRKVVDEKTGKIQFFNTKDSKGNEIKDKKKWQEVTFQNFRDTLSSGWLDSDSITAALQIYSGKAMTEEDWQKLGITDPEVRKSLEEIGRNALKSASEVRTFSKMMRTLKDSVASGWTKSFQYIFGDADEATKMWTGISDRLSNLLSRGSDARNKILKDWHDTREVLGTKAVDRSGLTNNGLVEELVYGRNGHEIFVDSIHHLGDILGEIGKGFSGAFSDVFGGMTGKKLFELTQKLEKSLINVKNSLGKFNEEGSRMNKIYRIVRGILSGIKLWKKAIRAVVDALVKLLAPGFDGIIDIAAQVGDWLYDISQMNPEEIIAELGKKLKEAWDAIKKFFTPEYVLDENGNYSTEIPAVKWLKNVWDKIQELGAQLLGSLGLQGVWDEITRIWGEITGWVTDSDIGRFLGESWTWLSEQFSNAWNFFTVPDEEHKKTGFVLWLEAVWEEIDRFWREDILANAEKVLGPIGSFFGNVWGWITTNIPAAIGWMTPPSDKIGFLKWIDSVWGKISSFWTETIEPNVNSVLEPIGNFFGNVWGWITTNIPAAVNWMTQPKGEIGFLSWIDSVWKKISSFWTETIEPNVNSVLEPIGSFFGNVWGWITTNIPAAVNWMTQPQGEIGFLSWIESIWKKISTFWNETIMPNASSVLEPIGSFFGNTWEWIKTTFNSAWDFMTKPNKDGQTGFSEWIESVWKTIQDIWGNISRVGKDVWEAIGGFLGNTWEWIKEKFGIAWDFLTSPNDEGDTGFTIWLSQVWDKVNEIWNTISDATAPVWRGIGEFLSDTWGWIMNLLGLGGSSESAGSGEGKVGKMHKAIEGIPNFVNDATELAGEIVINSNSTEPEKVQASVGIFERIIGAISDFIDKIRGFIEGRTDLGALGTFISGLGTFLNGALRTIGQILSFVGKYLGGEANHITTSEWGAIGRIVLPAIITLVTTIGSSVLAKGLGINFISIGQELQGLGIGIALITASIIGLANSGLSDDDLTKYGLIVGGIGLVTSIVIGISTSLTNARAKLNKSKERSAWGDFGEELVKQLGKVASLAVIMKLLPDIIKAVGEAKQAAGGGDIGMDVLWSMVGGIAAVGAVALAVAALSKLKLDPGSALTAIGTIVVSGWAVAAMVNLINMTLPSVSDAKAGAQKLSAIGEAVGGFLGGFVGKIGEGFIHAFGGMTAKDKADSDRETMALAFDKLTEMGQVLTPEKLQIITDMMERVGALKITNAESLTDASVINVLGGVDFKEFTEGFKTFVEALIEITDALTVDDNKMAKIINNEDQKNTLANVINAMESILSIFGYVDNDMYNIFGSQHDMERFFNAFSALTTEGYFGKFLDSIIDMYSNLSLRLNSVNGDSEGLSFSKIEQRMGTYRKMIDAINLIFEMFGNMTKGFIPTESYSTSLTPYRMMDNISEVVDENMFERFLNNISIIYGSLSRYLNKKAEANGMSFQDIIAKSKEYQDVIGAINMLFGVFSTGSIGSDEWIANFSNFASLIKREANGDESVTILSDYISSVEEIYKRLKDSSLAKDEGITFDGVKIVQRLFDAIQDGFDTGDIPSIDATPVTEEIIRAIGIGGPVLNKAIHDMIQGGIDSTTTPEVGGSQETGYDASKITEFISTLQSGASGLNLGDSFKTMLGGLLTDLTGEDTKKMLGDLTNAIPSFDDLLKDKGWITLDEDGKELDFSEYFGTEIKEVQESMKQIEAITLKIKPTFDLSEITQETLQGMLDNLKLYVPVNFKWPTQVNVNTDTNNKGNSNSNMNDKLARLLASKERFNITENGATYVDEAAYNNALAEIVNENKTGEITIQPIFDLTELSQDKLQEQLNEYTLTVPANISLPSLGIDLEGLAQAIDVAGIEKRLDDVRIAIEAWGLNNVTATDQLGVHMDGIGTHISNLRMVLDGDVLVGVLLPKIDVGLYKRGLHSTGRDTDVYIAVTP